MCGELHWVPALVFKFKESLLAILLTIPYVNVVYSNVVYWRLSPDFQWIEGDVCEVVLQFENILSIPLQLSNIVSNIGRELSNLYHTCHIFSLFNTSA